MCTFLEYFHGWVWGDVTVENTFMGGCTFLEYRYGWVSVFVTVYTTFMSECTFLKDIYGWVWLFRRLSWVGVTVYSIFMSGCDCLENFYGSMWVGVTGCGWEWVGVTGCGWVGKMVKPLINIWKKKTQIDYRKFYPTLLAGLTHSRGFLWKIFISRWWDPGKVKWDPTFLG